MKMHNRALALVILSLAPAATAAPWTTPAGINGTIVYTNGGDSNGRFSDPVVGEEKFVFADPIDFRAVSPGTPASNSDSVSVNVQAAPGYLIDTFAATIRGNYSFVETPAQLDFDATIFVNVGDYTANLTFVPASPLNSGEGEFIGTALIDLDPNVTSFQASLIANLAATSSGLSTTSIQINSAEIAFTTVLIPEPATLGLFGGIASLLLRRRR